MNNSKNASFTQTHWSQVRSAGNHLDPKNQAALATICQSYWYPIYAYIRRSGRGIHDSEDLTQSFFAMVIRKNLLATADPQKGRLRSFLLQCLQHFLSDTHDRDTALKRGAGKVLDFSSVGAEEMYANEPRDHADPERIYQRRWALQMLGKVMKQLAREYTETGKESLFEGLSPFLDMGHDKDQSYQATADTLGMNLNTLKGNIRRLRIRWKELLMDHVASTLADPTPENIKIELTELLRSM